MVQVGRVQINLVAYSLPDVAINYALCWLFVIFLQMIRSIILHYILNGSTMAIPLQKITDGKLFKKKTKKTDLPMDLTCYAGMEG